MRQAMTLWDLVSRKDKAALSRYIRWQEGGDGVRAGWIYFPDPEEPAPDKPLLPQGGQTSRGHFFIEEALDLFRADDVLMPALFTVQRWINSHLNEFAFPKLLCDPKKIRQGLFIVPRTLLGAIWLQFAQAVAGNKKYRACKECGEWFEVGKDGDARTARREFCSDICKSRDYRHRKEQARRLKAEGASLKDIAKELGTDLETIKKWVAKRKG